tara:strand:+ start:644 stop:778 length:135 start_codon:yes stop_codon:yes gene_type:complete
MTKKSIVVKSGDTWEYEDTPELQKALAKLHGTPKAIPPKAPKTT